MRSLLGAVAFLVFATPLSAQDDPYPHSIGERGFTGLSIFSDQDLLDPWRNMDRNYTMGAGIGLTGAMFSGFSAWPNRFVLGFDDLPPRVVPHPMLVPGPVAPPPESGPLGG